MNKVKKVLLDYDFNGYDFVGVGVKIKINKKSVRKMKIEKIFNE